MKTTVIHHSADFDGQFCREIARKFLPGAELIGWDFNDPPLAFPPDGEVYILDLPVDRVFGWTFENKTPVQLGLTIPSACFERMVWIDHHKSSIDSHPTSFSGYRVDGVAACRLAWQYLIWVFNGQADGKMVLPNKDQFTTRKVSEPLAVRLAGEYDVFEQWREDWPEIAAFQLGLRSRELTAEDWSNMLEVYGWSNMLEVYGGGILVQNLLRDGKLIQYYSNAASAAAMKRGSFLLEFEGLKFLALNSGGGGSLMFASRDVPETGHDALMLFAFNGTKWTVSLYHARHRTDLDLSKIAVKYGGGGHRGACGFNTTTLPFKL